MKRIISLIMAMVTMFIVGAAIAEDGQAEQDLMEIVHECDYTVYDHFMTRHLYADGYFGEDVENVDLEILIVEENDYQCFVNVYDWWGHRFISFSSCWFIDGMIDKDCRYNTYLSISEWVLENYPDHWRDYDIEELARY